MKTIGEYIQEISQEPAWASKPRHEIIREAHRRRNAQA